MSTPLTKMAMEKAEYEYSRTGRVPKGFKVIETPVPEDPNGTKMKRLVPIKHYATHQKENEELEYSPVGNAIRSVWDNSLGALTKFNPHGITDPNPQGVVMQDTPGRQWRERENPEPRNEVGVDVPIAQPSVSYGEEPLQFNPKDFDIGLMSTGAKNAPPEVKAKVAAMIPPDLDVDKLFLEAIPKIDVEGIYQEQLKKNKQADIPDMTREEKMLILLDIGSRMMGAAGTRGTSTAQAFAAGGRGGLEQLTALDARKRQERKEAQERQERLANSGLGRALQQYKSDVDVSLDKRDIYMKGKEWDRRHRRDQIGDARWKAEFDLRSKQLEAHAKAAGASERLMEMRRQIVLSNPKMFGGDPESQALFVAGMRPVTTADMNKTIEGIVQKRSAEQGGMSKEEAEALRNELREAMRGSRPDDRSSVGAGVDPAQMEDLPDGDDNSGLIDDQVRYGARANE